MGSEEKLSEEMLTNVTGGKNTDYEDKRAQFEHAWDTQGMTEKGYSGMRMAVIFDEWEMAGFKPDAAAFLSQYK